MLSTRCTLYDNDQCILIVGNCIYLQEVRGTCLTSRLVVDTYVHGQLHTVHQQSCHQVVAQTQSVVIYLPPRLEPGEQQDETIVYDVQHTDRHRHCMMAQLYI